MASTQTFRLGTAVVDLERHEVVHPRRTVTLTTLEVRLLAHLAKQPGTVVSRDELLREVWGYAAGTRTRAPHHAVTRIRKKVELDPTVPIHLISVYGEGYRLDSVEGPAPGSVSPVLEHSDSVSQLRDRTTSFIGRQAEIGRMEDWLSHGPRVLTIVGPAGAGKTRLCRRFASTKQAAFPGGSWLVDLDGADTPMGVAVAVARTLGIQASGDDLMAQLAAVLHGRGLSLVVLDDLQCEGAFLTAWLEAAPRLRVVVTSRRRLVLPSQQLFFLRPLSKDDALALLHARAQLNASQTSQLEPGSEPLDRLIESLDALPLAIELAAARLRIMGVEGVLDKLEDRFRLLRAQGSGAVEPHKSDLRAVLEASWRQLSPQIQLGLAHCSVFRGPFSLDAAEAVIDLSDWPGEAGAWDVLESLEDHCLLEVVGSSRRRPRFRLLHSVRDLARGFLATPNAIQSASGTALTGPGLVVAARARHAAHFASLGSSERLERLQTAQGPIILKELHEEIDELLIAFEWAVSNQVLVHAAPLADAVLEVASGRGPVWLAGDSIQQLLNTPGLCVSDAVRIAARHGRMQSRAGRWDDARTALEAVLGLVGASGTSEHIAQLREALGEIEIAAGNLEVARAHLNQALDCQHRAGDATVGLLAQIGLGQIDKKDGRLEEASARFKDALEPIRRAGNKRMEAVLYCHLGGLAQARGGLSHARHRYTQALEISREIGTRFMELSARGLLAGVLVEQGLQAEAEVCFQENLVQCRELGVVRLEALSLGNLATLYRSRDDLEAAERAYMDSIDLLDAIRDPVVATIMRGNLAEALLRMGRGHEASELIEGVLQTIAAGHASWTRGHFLGVAAEVRFELGNTEGAWQALNEGEELLRSSGRLVELGKMLVRRCGLLIERADHPGARAALEEAEELSRRVGASLDSELWREILRQQQRLAQQSAGAPAQ